MQQATPLRRRQHGNSIVGAERTQVRAFERINCNVDFRTRGGHLFSDAESRTNLFADEEHGRFVALAFADDHAATHRHAVHNLAHGLDGNLIGIFAVALAHCARGGNRGRLSHA